MGIASPLEGHGDATVRSVRVRDERRALVENIMSNPTEDETIPVELGGVTRYVRRSEVKYVEAHGDYARLVTASAHHLIRVPLVVLEERWAPVGFARIHRRHLVSLAAIDEVLIEAGKASVRIGDCILDVSRRHTREFRDRLVRHARPS
jgi:two-component system, LytTR family, response regulator LytT